MTVHSSEKSIVPYRLYSTLTKDEIDNLFSPHSAHCRCYNELLSDLEYNNNCIQLNSLPLIAQVEVTTKCNIKCVHCGRIDWLLSGVFGDKARALKGEDIAWDTFQCIIPILPYVKLCIVSGFGEPLLYSRFQEMIEIIRKYGADIHFTTNGLLLDREMVKFLIERQAYIIAISLDAATSKTYDSIRKGSNFEKVIENIHNFALMKIRAKSSRPEIRLDFIAMRRNIEELPQFVELAHRLGADAVLVDYLRVLTEDMKADSLYFHQDLANKYILDARTTAKKLGIKLDDYGLFGHESVEKQAAPTKCKDVWNKVYIQFDGTIYPCCLCKTPMGSLRSHSIVEIWNNQAYQDLRYSFVAGNPPDHCKYCLFSSSRDIINKRGTHIGFEREPQKELIIPQSNIKFVPPTDEDTLRKEYNNLVDYAKYLEVYKLICNKKPVESSKPLEDTSAWQITKPLLQKLLPTSYYDSLRKWYHTFKTHF